VARWFLPETPDVLGTLRAQASLTVDAMEALERWAGGDAGAGADVRRIEHEADVAKRDLRISLRASFTVPVDAEDLYTLSERLDVLVNGAKDTVREADVMEASPDPPMARMASELAEGARHLAAALDLLGTHDDAITDRATAEADLAIKQSRKLERTYRKAMSGLLDIDDLREVAARRELYRRFTHLGERMAQIGDRIWYAAVKEA
jgi:uncharacterized protein Yka (UPF0111/DUF47 family)